MIHHVMDYLMISVAQQINTMKDKINTMKDKRRNH